jgi:hypothetical protein
MIRILEELLQSPQSFWENEQQKQKVATAPHDKPGSRSDAHFLQGYVNQLVGHSEPPNAREAEAHVEEEFSGRVLCDWLRSFSRSNRMQWAVQTQMRSACR